MPDTTNTPASASTVAALFRFLKDKLGPEDYDNAQAIVTDGSGAAMDADLRRRVTAAAARQRVVAATAVEKRFPGAAKLKRAL